MRMKKALLAGLAGTLFLTTPALAQRVDTARAGVVKVASECPITQPRSKDQGPKEFAFEAALGGIAASFVGDLASSAIDGIANAIKNASREQGFVTEGVASYEFFVLQASLLDADTPDPDDRKPVSLIQPPRCAILYVEGSEPLSGLISDPLLAQLRASLATTTGPSRLLDDGIDGNDAADQQRLAAVLADLKKIGLSRLPEVYVEAELAPHPDGMTIRPRFVWRRIAENGSPKGVAANELQLTFATPASGGDAVALGAPFSTVRLPLPRLAPGEMAGPARLIGRESVILPRRPTSGQAGDQLKAFEAEDTAVDVAKAEVRSTARAKAAAERAWQNDKSFENKEALLTAEIAAGDAVDALKVAEAARSPSTPKAVGGTNLEMRFVVIRDENKFGMAIANALGARKDDIGKAVTDALKPENPVSEADYLQALADVRGKDREIDKAQAEGNTADVARLRDELVVLKAKANDEAVKVGRSRPFPGLAAQLR